MPRRTCSPATAPAPTAQALKTAAQEKAGCTDKCHAPIKAFHDDGKHKTRGLHRACHGELPTHIADKKVRPATKTDPAACGSLPRAAVSTRCTR